MNIADLKRKQCDVEFQVKYYTALSQQYWIRMRIYRIALATTSVAAVLVLASPPGERFPALYQSLSVLTAILALVYPFLTFEERAVEAGDLAERLAVLDSEYRQVLNLVSKKGAIIGGKEMVRINAAEAHEAELRRKITRLPDKIRLKKRIQQRMKEKDQWFS